MRPVAACGVMAVLPVDVAELFSILVSRCGAAGLASSAAAAIGRPGAAVRTFEHIWTIEIKNIQNFKNMFYWNLMDLYYMSSSNLFSVWNILPVSHTKTTFDDDI